MYLAFKVTSIIFLAFLFCIGNDLAGAEPTNAEELACKTSAKMAASNADKARKAKMSKDELAWEKVLEENLGSFYLPRYKKAKADGKVTAWDYLKDDPKLPRILLIGDSISRAYTLTVRKELKGIANVHRAPANCGPTKTALKKLSVWLGKGKWDVITFNFGIHDRSTKNKIYAKNLETIAVSLTKTGTRLIWVNSTPLSKGTMGFKRGMMPPKNLIAAGIMKKHAIPIIDLHSAAQSIIKHEQLKDGCHYTNNGNEAFGEIVAEGIRQRLKK